MFRKYANGWDLFGRSTGRFERYAENYGYAFDKKYHPVSEKNRLFGTV